MNYIIILIAKASPGNFRCNLFPGKLLPGAARQHLPVISARKLGPPFTDAAPGPVHQKPGALRRFGPRIPRKS